MIIFSNVFGKIHGGMIILILLMSIGIIQNIVGDIQKKKYDLGVQNLISI